MLRFFWILQSKIQRECSGFGEKYKAKCKGNAQDISEQCNAKYKGNAKYFQGKYKVNTNGILRIPSKTHS